MFEVMVQFYSSESDTNPQNHIHETQDVQGVCELFMQVNQRISMPDPSIIVKAILDFHKRSEIGKGIWEFHTCKNSAYAVITVKKMLVEGEVVPEGEVRYTYF